MSDLHAELAWATVRLETIDRFNGETPRPDTEAAIIDVFELAPKAVLRAIDEIAAALDRGEIRSGWAILRNRLDQRAQPVRDATVRGVDERAKRIAQAEQWMRAAGIHYDRDTEVEDELFGERGLLRAWRTDRPLVERMLDLWDSLRPTGVRIERQHLVHMGRRRIVAARAARIAKRHPEPVLDVDQTAPEPDLATLEPDLRPEEPSLA